MAGATQNGTGDSGPIDYTGLATTFCAGPLWSTRVTWNGRDAGPDFTPCFHKTALVYGPCAILWALAPLEQYLSVLAARSPGAMGPIGRTWQNQSRAAATALLMIVAAMEFFDVVYLSAATSVPIVGADFVSPVVKFVTAGLSMILARGARKAGRLSSAVQFAFWLALSICWGFTFGEVVSGGNPFLDWNVLESVVLVLQFILAFGILVLNCFADRAPDYMDIKEQIINPSPEKRVSWFNRLLFFWFDSTVWRARKRVIDEDMLWDLNREDSVYHLHPQWQKLWSNHIAKHRFQQGSGNKGKKGKPPTIMRPLAKAIGGTLLVSAVYQFFYVLLQFASPQLLNLLIAFVEGDEPVWHGYFYTVMFSVVALAVATSDSGYWYRVNLIGLRVRSALSSAIYRKSLRLSNGARKKYTAGEIVNLISVDCQKLQDACLFLNMMWASPLQVGLSIFFLYQKIGVSVFAGLGALAVLFPVNSVIWAWMERYQVRQMSKKDERVRMVTEILAGIKVLKLYAWEPSFVKRIGDIRNTEIGHLRAFQYLEATQFFAWTCAPFLVALASFTTYVLIDPVNNILDAQTAFVSLTLFNTMRGPLFLLPFGIVSLIQGVVSIKRISEYLAEPELKPEAISHGENSPFPVSLSHCSFMWDDRDEESGAGVAASACTLKDLTWRVEEGALVAVVGTVGSGKSSLLSAILGEMTKVEGDVNVKGRIAYVPQQAWMQNETLRNNILFGKELNVPVYEKVIEACALKPDLEILTGGDQTEIGEKGINVSGGQKQRISLARAVYSNADLYLLDDPLSAVDSHVGKHIFEKVIGPTGALKKKTRVLVTHAISFLPDMDQIVVMKDGKISEVGTYEELMRSRGAFAEFLLEQLQQQEEASSPNTSSSGSGSPAGPGSPPTMSESEREDIRQQLAETLGEREVAKALTEARKKKRRSKKSKRRKPRVKTTSIGSLSDHDPDPDRHYLSEQESVFSLGAALNKGSKAGGNVLLRGESIVEEKEGEEEDMETKTKIQERNYEAGRDLITEETAATHRVKFSIYVYYAKSVGGPLSITGIVFYALFQLFTVGANLWLSVWSQDETAVEVSRRNMYLAVYGVFGLLQSSCILVAVVIITVGTLRASVTLHKQMLERVLGSTMAFFDTTPIGRIVNRFSKDIDEVDIMIPTHIKDLLNSLFSVLGTLFVICYASPVIIVFVVPMIFVFIFVQSSYLAASRQLKRMVSVTRSPVNSSLTESFSGAATIRAFRAQERFTHYNDGKIEANQKFYYPEVVSASWLFCRLEGLANVLIVLASLFSVIFRDSINPGLVGLSLTYALTFQLDIFFLTRFTADLEKSIVSVERIKEYQQTPAEAPFSIPHQDPRPDAWPSEGAIEFREYATRYREGMDLVLRGVTCSIRPMEKVGIVGRTGAGKSSLTLSLFRIIESAGGAIVVDGVDIAKIGLGRLREALTIIPQDPVLFTGTLRSNLDPFGAHTDERIWSALGHAHLKGFAASLERGLDHEVSEGGENLSVGQRQLVCLARALLRKTKILILDEATAAVDLETDDLIQATIRSEFSDCTVLTIAHRLKTIMDSDKILLLDAGRVLEFDSPTRLLADPKSSFFSMARDAGLV